MYPSRVGDILTRPLAFPFQLAVSDMGARNRAGDRIDILRVDNPAENSVLSIPADDPGLASFDHEPPIWQHLGHTAGDIESQLAAAVSAGLTLVVIRSLNIRLGEIRHTPDCPEQIFVHLVVPEPRNIECDILFGCIFIADIFLRTEILFDSDNNDVADLKNRGRDLRKGKIETAAFPP